MAVWHVSGPTVYGHTGDVGDDGRLWLELGGIGTKGLAPQGPQDRGQCLRRSDEGSIKFPEHGMEASDIYDPSRTLLRTRLQSHTVVAKMCDWMTLPE